MISDQSPKIQDDDKTIPAYLPARRSLKRRLLGTALAFLIFVLCLGSLVATLLLDVLNNYGVAYGKEQPRIPYTSPADLNGANPLGVNTFLHLETDPASVDRILDMVRDGGFGFIRQSFPWQYIEPERGQYTWAKFDAIVEKAAARNIQIIARIDLPPYWARPKEYDRLKEARPNDFQNITGPPENYADYGSFVAEVARRYQGKLRFYQIWNEPNLANEWNDHRVNPQEYVNLLKVAYPALKQADPKAVVLAAPLSPTDQDGPNFNNLNELKYLDEMYKAGAKNYFDIMSVQMYGLGYSPDFRWLWPDFRAKDWRRVNLNRAAATHEIMEKNGDTAKAVWGTEYGWISVPPGLYLNDYKTRWNEQWGESIDEQTQADYLVGGLERARKEWPWLGVVNVWFFRPDPKLSDTPENPTNYFALVNADFQPRPAYLKLKQYASQAYKVAGTGWIPASDPSVTYSAGNSPVIVAGDKLNFSFEGERAEIVLTPRRDGILKVSIDGTAKEIIFKAGGETRLTLAENLKYGPHVAQLSFESGTAGNPVGQLSGFYVSNDNHFGWLVLLLYGGLGLGTLGSGGVLGWRAGQGLGWLAPRVWTKLRWLAGWLWRYRKQYAPYGMLVAMAIYYFAPPLPLAVFGALLFFPMALARPDWAILLAIMFAPLYLHPRDLKLSQSPVDTLIDLTHPRDPHDTRPRLEFSLTEVIIVLTTAAWITRILFACIKNWLAGDRSSRLNFAGWFKVENIRGFIKKQGPFALPLLGFFLISCVSLLVPEPSHLKEALREFRVIIVEPLLIYLLAAYFFKGRTGASRIFDVLIGTGVAVALMGIWQFVFGSEKTVAAEGVGRIVSIYNHPDNLGLFLGRIIPLAAAYVLFGGTEWNRRRWLYLIALGPLLATLLLSFSRGAWIGTGLALLAMVVAAGSRRGLIVYGAGFLLVLAALPFVKVERITSLFSFVNGSNSTRLHVWQAAIQMLKDHPLTGIGLDQFLYKYSVEYVPPEAWLERFTSHPHNLVLDYWLRLGIIGLVITLWLLILFYKTLLQFGLRGTKLAAKQSLKKIDNKLTTGDSGLQANFARRVMLLGLLGSMTDFIIHGLVDNSYFLVDLALVFCLSFALVEILRREALAEKENHL